MDDVVAWFLTMLVFIFALVGVCGLISPSWVHVDPDHMLVCYKSEYYKLVPAEIK